MQGSLVGSRIDISNRSHPMDDLKSELGVDRIGRVTVLTLRRPAFGNRLTQSLLQQLCAALDAARRDTTVAGCVLTGQGEVFCLGGDYDSVDDNTAGRMEFGRAHIDLFNSMARFGKPVVAAVNGDAHAGGFSLVVACDLAFVSETATLGLPEAARGLFPFLALAVVADALPKKLLFEIVYDSRLMTAKEACNLHVANAAVPPEQVLVRAIEAVERASCGNSDVLMLGRDLYYSTRGMKPVEALDQSRLALASALASRAERR
jgi:enoyl-CoA hydratase/carnithine racemase